MSSLTSDGQPILNGIDYLEVIDSEVVSSNERQRIIYLFLIKPPTYENEITPKNIMIDGGERIRDINVTNVEYDKEKDPKLLVLTVNKAGDFSRYTLSLLEGPQQFKPPTGFDPILSSVVFSFKVECPNDFDCLETRPVSDKLLPNPSIDYLAKDYSSFRQLMLDRLAIILPDWQGNTPADIGITLIEILAYAGDYLSYYQDAVATEAYLGTARKRVSVRRHARLLDYFIHEGNNARVWICLEYDPSFRESVNLDMDSMFLTKFNAPTGTINKELLKNALNEDVQIFKPLHTIELRESRNEIHFHTWGDTRCCLPKGTVKATLRGDNKDLLLKKGDVLVFQEILGPNSGLEIDANPEHNHAVRLDSDPITMDDPVVDGGVKVTEISWHHEDALPFPLCVWELDTNSENAEGKNKYVSVARGNVILADHGRPVVENIKVLSSQYAASNRTVLTHPNISHCELYDHEKSKSHSASSICRQDFRKVLPDITLEKENEKWTSARDLLSSDRFASEFVVEVENNGKSYLRFGDNVQGRKPSDGAVFTARYRTGIGSEGNIGSNAIAHIITGTVGITKVFNPVPAIGGTDPESIEQVKLYAPRNFHVQERAVTVEDYALVAQRHPAVQKAVATLRWTGSWHTVFITVDRKGGWSVDTNFKKEMKLYLEKFRLTGHDIEIDSPRFVSLEIAMTVQVKPGFLRTTIKKALQDIFGSRDISGGQRGYFHPDNFTFGQPVYLSDIIKNSMKIHGVEHVDVNIFQRFGHPSTTEMEEGVMKFGRLEIARLDNTPNAPENGKIEFVMKGGL
ncbi:MAG: putative baseplate assembly protein [Nitrospinota bacterium]|nr:putative baseplate assembly protein [Nitrospinota bacterium]